MRVVCVHGALRSSFGMWPTAAFLRAQGLQPECFGWATRRASLEQHAERLAAVLGRPRGPLGFVTHSMGALVVRSWLARRGTDVAGVRVAMLSPPNGGSTLARLHRDDWRFGVLYGRAAGPLLGEGLPPVPPPGVAIKIFAGGTGRDGYHPRLPGDDDGVVAWTDMKLGWRQPVLVGGRHTFLQWRPDVLRQVAAFLRSSD